MTDHICTVCHRATVEHEDEEVWPPRCCTGCDCGSGDPPPQCEATSPDGERCKYRLGHDATGEPHSWTRFGFGLTLRPNEFTPDEYREWCWRYDER